MDKILRLTLFGSPYVYLGDQLVSDFATNKAQALLFYLVVTGQPHSRDHLATLLWDEMTDAQAKKNLRTVLPDVRRLLGDQLLLDRQTLAFQPLTPYWLDVDVLRRSLTSRPVATDLAVRQAALALYQGEFLSGFYVHNAPAFDAWVLAQRAQLHTLVVDALVALVDEYAQQVDIVAALAANRRLLGLEPWSEPVHRQQMLLLAQMGERAAALAQYETCQRILATEFGVAPVAETTALYQQIRAGELGHRGVGETGSQGDRGSLPEPAVNSQPVQRPRRDDAHDLARKNLDSKRLTPVVGHNLPHPTKLYGRQEELARLHQWIGEDGCRLVGIFGIGGQGKTALAAALVRSLAESAPQPMPEARFERIVWQSLLNAPPLAEVLQEWLYVLSDQTVTSLPTSLDQQFNLLFDYVRRQRCLLVLDNLESILQADEHGGYYRAGYEAYGQLLHRFVAGEQRSCLLLTSRERPQDSTHWEEDTPAVRFLALAGLPAAAGQAKLQARGVAGNLADLTALVQRYSGNPLALKLVADTVQSIFAGNIAAFLQAEVLVFDDIRHILDQQFARLTTLERELMIWLAIVREPVAYSVLRDLLAQPPAGRLVLEAVRSLQRRSLLEKYEEGFGLQNVVLEYTTALLVENISHELLNDQLMPTLVECVGYEKSDKGTAAPDPLFASYLNRYALILAQIKEYVRASQTRLLLQPVASHLLAQLGVRGVEQQLQAVLTHLRTVPLAPGYAAANLLHLLLQLDMKLGGYDFSQLTVRQANLRGVSLPRINFAGSDLTDTRFTEPLGRIFTVVFSPDGRFLVAGTREGSIHLWRTADQQLAQVIQAHNHALIDLAFAPPLVKDARTSLVLASAGEDQTVGLWRLAEDMTPQRTPGQPSQLLHGHQHTVIGVGFGVDNQHLASVDLAGNVYVWEMATGQPVYYFNCQLPKFWVAAFSSDGHTLAIGSNDGLVYLWQVNGTLTLVLAGHKSDIRAVAFSPTGKILASGGGDGRICLWSLPDGQLQQVLDATSGFVLALAFSPDGETLASSHWDRTVRLWSTRAQAQDSLLYAPTRSQLRHTLVGHTHVIRSVAFSPDGRLLASGGSDQTVRVWDAQAGQPLYTLRGHHYALNAIALSPDGTKLAAVGYDQLIHLWQWRGVHNSTDHRALQGHRGLLHTVAFSPDGRTLVSAGRDPAIHLWDVDSGQLRHTLHGHLQDTYRVVFHPSGNLLASGSADGTVRLWDLRTLKRDLAEHGQLTGSLPATTGAAIYTLAFSPDGGLLATAGIGPTIHLWDMTQADRPELVEARKTAQVVDEREILSVAFSPDNTKLAGGGTNLIHLWDLLSGELPLILHHHVDWVMSVAFSPDGATLASASEDRTICLWNVADGTLRTILRGHNEGVYSVVFNADGTCVLSGSADGTIKFWDSQTGECINTLRVEGPYAGMNITGITGITEAQKTALKILGAIEAV